MAGPIPVTVNITATGTSPSRKNFGTPLVLAYHTHYTDKVRIYTSLGGMITDGFSTTEPAYLLAQACFQQNPTVPQVFVGRGTTAVQQTFTFTVTANADGVPVGLSILDPSGTVHDLYVTPSSETIDQVATALALVIAAASGVSSSTASGAVITTTITAAGNTWYPSLTPHDETVFAGGFQGGTFADTTSTASVAADLAAILLVNANFYGVSTQYIDPTNIAAAAAWVQSNGCLFAYVTADSANLTANTGIGHTLKGDSYTRSCGIYTQTPGDFVTTGLMAQRFTAVAGSDTWAYKTVIGATPDDNLTPTQLANLQTNNLNYYATVAGIECVTDGRSAQGQYMDIQRGIDALANDMQVRVFGLIANSEKVPYTTAGITMVGTQMRASLASFTATPSSPNLFLSSDPGFAPTVTLPDISTISTSDKQNRILNNANFTATTTGAIQDVIINGTLSFG